MSKDAVMAAISMTGMTASHGAPGGGRWAAGDCTSGCNPWDMLIRTSIVDEVELHPVEQGVLADRTSMGRPRTKRFPIPFARPPHILGRDRAKRHHLHRVDLDPRRPDRIPARHLDLRPLPQSERHRDAS